MDTLYRKIFKIAKERHTKEFPDFGPDSEGDENGIPYQDTNYWKRWLQIWYSVAVDLRTKMQEEGLESTVNHMDDMLRTQYGFLNPKEKSYIMEIYRGYV